MTTVNTPDGPVNFPDTMSEEEIKVVLRRKFPRDSPRSQLGAVNRGFGAEVAPPDQDQAAYDAQIQQGMAESQTGRRNEAAGAAYEALPGYLKPVQAASDLLTVGARLPASMLTGAATLVSGEPDKSITPEHIIARLRTGQTEGPAFETEVAKQKQQYEDAAYRSGWAGTAAQVAATAGLPVAKIFGAGKPLLNVAATGGAGGMTAAAGSEEDPLLGAAAGAGGGVLGYGLGKGISFGTEKLLGAAGKVLPFGPLKVPPTPKAMTPEEFRTTAGAAYDEAERHGVVFNQQGLVHLRNRIQKELADKGYAPENQPGLTATLRTLDKYIATGNATQRGMQTLREMTSGGYQFQNKKNNMLVSKVIDEIDDLAGMANPNFMSATTKNPKAAAEAARRARALYHQGAKLQLTQDLIESGGLQGDTNISKNIRQSIRKKLKTVVDPLHSRGRGFTAQEKAGFEKAIKTTTAQDIAHGLSGWMPRDKLSAAVTSVPLIAALATVGANPLGAALALGGTAARFGIGFGAEKVANRMAQKSVDDLVHLIATGQTTKQAAQSVLQKLSASKRAAVLAGLARVGAATGTATQPLNDPETMGEINRFGSRVGGAIAGL